MIRLVVSDVDGTLASDGSHKINPRLFEIITELKKRNILFAIASGRQLPSIRRLFEPVSENVIFIAENGAYVVCRDSEMSVTPMNRTCIEQIVADVRSTKDTIVTLSGREATYVESRDEEFLDLMVNGYKNKIQIVDDVLAVDTTVIKLAMYRKSGIFDIEERFVTKWQDKVKVVVAGNLWLDFMDKKVDKGNAIRTIQQIIGISKEETISFGDNSNDIGMFHASGRSYVVCDAREEVQKQADEVIGSCSHDSVVKKLEEILEGIKE